MRVSTMKRAAGVVPVLLMAGLAARLGAADETTALPPAACASLQGMIIPATAIGLETSGAEVQAAAMVAASASGNPNGEYCKVTGIVKPKNPSSPSLEFEVNLPASWNRRALQMGGGGYNGTLVTGLTGFTLQPATVENPLKQGYVTLGKALAIENDAQIQNSSGAVVRSTVVCTYDLRTDRILNVVVSAAP